MKRKLLTRIALVLSLILLLTSTVQTTFGFIYTQTDPINGVFVPETVQPGSLTVTKTVRHPFGDSYVIPVSFDFKLSLGSYYANAKLDTSQGELTANQSGELTVSIRPGTPFVINSLESGTVVTVRELQMPASSGFTPENNVTEKQVTITDNGVSADFVNIYKPAPVSAASVSLNGIKELEGRPWQNGDSFSFALEQKINNVWTQLGSPATVTYSNNANFNRFDMSELLDNVTFDTVGDYFFRVLELQGDLENIDYDKTVKEFKITVTDTDMDGKLEIATVSGAQNVTVSKNEDAYNVSVTFNNTFKPTPDPDPVTVTLTANKTVNNLTPVTIGPDGFEIVLKNLTTNQPVALTTVNGKAVFELTFDKTDVGTHTFSLYETDLGASGITYDETVYTVTVVVSLENNQLKVKINNDDTTQYSATFVNTYKPETPPPTGDSNKYIWLAIMLLSLCAFVALLIVDKRRTANI